MRFDGKTTKREFMNLKLNKLSVVPNPAQAPALVSIIKQASNLGVPDSNKEATEVVNKKIIKGDNAQMDVKEKLEPMLKGIEKADEIVKSVEQMITESVKAEVKKAIDDAKEKAKEEIEKTKEEFVELNGTKIAKSAIPEEVLAVLKANQAEVEELKKQADINMCIKKAEADYPNISGSPEDKGMLIYTLKSLDKDTRTMVEKSLKSCNDILGLHMNGIGYAAVQKSEEEVYDSPQDRLIAQVRKERDGK